MKNKALYVCLNCRTQQVQDSKFPRKCMDCKAAPAFLKKLQEIK